MDEWMDSRTEQPRFFSLGSILLSNYKDKKCAMYIYRVSTIKLDLDNSHSLNIYLRLFSMTSSSSSCESY